MKKIFLILAAAVVLSSVAWANRNGVSAIRGGYAVPVVRKISCAVVLRKHGDLLLYKFHLRVGLCLHDKQFFSKLLYGFQR